MKIDYSAWGVRELIEELEKRDKTTREVKIYIEGGNAEVMECPDDVVVKCLDADNGDTEYIEMSLPL